MRKLSAVLFTLIALTILLSSQEEEKKKDRDKKPVITEEITVTAPEPQDRPLASTTVIPQSSLKAMNTKNLSEILSFASGTYVSTGTKGEAHIKIRGFDTDKSTLMVDGIPIYDPYFNTYDLKSITSEEIESVKIVKGSSSVLYGANTLGGIVDVLTRRPNPPSLSLKASLSRDSTSFLSATGAYGNDRFIFLGSVLRDKSDGSRVKLNGETGLLPNSQWEKTNLTGKLYIYPGRETEVLLQASYLDSEYNVPAATAYYSPRYWKFPEWKRLSLGGGITTPLLSKGTLKVRTYYLKYDNTLENYKDPALTKLTWTSLYRNSTWGAFLLGSHPLGNRQEINFSFNAKKDKVEQQGSATSPWEYYEQTTFSAGLEDRFRITEKWSLIGGINIDTLDKKEGKTKSTVNPIGGIKFNPTPFTDIHLTYSRKSRFPSMKSLYSTSGGNPDLKDERGQTMEVGFLYNKDFTLSGALFITEVDDLIYTVRLPTGYKSYKNIGESRTKGFELEAGKRWWSLLDLSLRYTFLDTRNKDEDRRLELVPESQLNWTVGLSLPSEVRIFTWGVAASSSEIMISDKLISVPGYTIANLSIEKSFGPLSLYVKGENLFDKEYFTEPGYPMASRRIEGGIRIDLGGTR